MIYSLEELRQEYQRGERYDFLLFYGHELSRDGSIGDGCFSQFWMEPFEVDGVVYLCAEQYMMAAKSQMFNDAEIFEKIMDSELPAKMKSLGRKVRGFDNDIWEKNRYEIVKAANIAKFGENSELRARLFDTRGRILVEASPSDTIWGIGMAKNNPDAENPMKWRGKNLLGFALTEVRDELLRNEPGKD